MEDFYKELYLNLTAVDILKPRIILFQSNYEKVAHM